VATVVLCHGILGRFFDQAADGVGPVRLPSARYFGGIREGLEAAGHRVLTPPTGPMAAIETRATQIRDFLDEHVAENETCILVGHSMGGLDCRHLVTHLDGGRLVDHLLTVATPHRGSAVADFCMKNLQNRAKVYDLIAMLGLDTGGCSQLTRESMARFNACTPDVPGVRYFSITTATPVRKMGVLFRPGGRLLDAEEGPNDGLVSAASSAWGTVLARWELDHMQTLNKRLIGKTDAVTPRWIEAIERVSS
jgi:triacylglycerol lipase